MWTVYSRFDIHRCEHWHAHNGAALFTALGMVSEATSRTNAYYSALSVDGDIVCGYMAVRTCQRHAATLWPICARGMPAIFPRAGFRCWEGAAIEIQKKPRLGVESGLQRGRLPTFPLSQYHRRGGV